MVGVKDFLVGCLTIILCILLLPVVYLVCKLGLSLAIIIGAIALVAIGIALFGKIIRLIFSKEKRT